MNVGSIDEEILKKGLEISQLTHTKSLAFADNSNKLIDRQRIGVGKY